MMKKNKILAAKAAQLTAIKTQQYLANKDIVMNLYRKKEVLKEIFETIEQEANNGKTCAVYRISGPDIAVLDSVLKDMTILHGYKVSCNVKSRTNFLNYLFGIKINIYFGN